MMDWTDRHARYFLRLLTRFTLLYTEMVTAAALLHGDPARLLAHDPAEYPLALQVGGGDPEQLAACAVLAAEHGFDEVNINVGCPSDRVQSGNLGACLFAQPERVAACVAAMRAAGPLPVTVKTRTGIDDLDHYADLRRFVGTVADAGCTTFIIHARKAWLNGLSPRENRERPVLDYARVMRLKRDHPELEIILNGGVTTLDAALAHLTEVDGVMIGRAAYHNPYLLATADQRVFGDSAPTPSRRAVVDAYSAYVERQSAGGVTLAHMTRHLLGLYHGRPGARAWRRALSEGACRARAGIEVIHAALSHVEEP